MSQNVDNTDKVYIQNVLSQNMNNGYQVKPYN